MSVEITLYPINATKKSLISFLKENGFKRVQHIFEELDNENNIGFMWFERKDLISLTGVEATVIKVDKDNMDKYKCSEWILHTRTRSSGSYEDKSKQNKIIKLARQNFGGSFYNDWYGKNRYTKLNDYTQHSPLEKGIFLLMEEINEKIAGLLDCLNYYEHPFTANYSDLPPSRFTEFIHCLDPSKVLFNCLIPFLISLIEYFFREIFICFLKFEPNIKSVFNEEKIKFSIEDVQNIILKTKSLEEYIADNYNFQNLEITNKVYKKYLNIDIFSILSIKKRIGRKIVRLKDLLGFLIFYRHKFIHELAISYDITKDTYISYLKGIQSIFEILTKEIQEKYNLNFDGM